MADTSMQQSESTQLFFLTAKIRGFWGVMYEVSEQLLLKIQVLWYVTLSFRNTLMTFLRKHHPIHSDVSRYSGIFRRVGDVSGYISTSASISSVRVQGILCSD
jgi:hypothetical protein